MPEEKDSVRTISHETAAKYHIGYTLHHWFEESVIFFRVVFKVCILDNQVGATGFLNTGTDSRTLALIHFMTNILQLYMRVVSPKTYYLCSGIICRIVIHYHQLLLYIFNQLYSLHSFKDIINIS